jgi:hypothetical protein
VHRVLHAAVPGYDHFRVSGRWIFLLGPLLVPLAAVGLSALAERDRDAARAATFAAVVVSALAVALPLAGVLIRRVPARDLATDSLFVVAVVGALALAVRTRAIVAVAAVVLMLEAFAHTTTWYGAHREAGALPRLPAITQQRDAGRLIRLTPALTQLPPFLADVPLAYGMDDASGWAVFLPRDIDDYMNKVEDHADFAKLTNVEPSLTSVAALRSPLLDALNVSTVLVDPGVTEPLPWPVVGTVGSVRVLHRPTAVGAATLVFGNGTVRLVDETSDTQRYSLSLTEGSIVQVSGRFDPGWTARIDGKQTKVLRTAGLFRSVDVPAGRHELTWRYRNPDARTGRLLGLAALLACGVLLSLGRRRVLPSRAAAAQLPQPEFASSLPGGSPPS